MSLDSALLLRRLLERIQSIKYKPYPVADNQLDQIEITCRRVGRLEACDELLDFIHAELRRGSDEANP